MKSLFDYESFKFKQCSHLAGFMQKYVASLTADQELVIM
jgi:hypothetical protein